MSKEFDSKALSDIAKRLSKAVKEDNFVTIVADNETAGRITNWVSTGNYALNYTLSGRYDGGLPVGRIVEYFGDPSTGKSLMCYHILAETQKRGGLAVLFDTEGAYTRSFGEAIGIDNSRLLLAEPNTVEEVFTLIEEICKISAANNTELTTVVWDSIAQTSTRKEMSGDFGTQDMGLKAKMIRAGFRRIGRLTSKSNVLLVGANHKTAKIGVMYGKKTTTPGGTGYAFASSLRVELTKGPHIGDSITDRIIGTEAKAYVDKSKVAGAYGECVVNVYFDKGIDKYSGLLDILVNDGIIEQRGTWYYYTGSDEEVKFQGKNKFNEFMAEHPEIIEGLINRKENNE